MKRLLGTIGAGFLVLALATGAATRAQTPTFTVLHSFTGPDGAHPLAGVIIDAAGNLYGTTSAGGAFNMGTVFRFDTSGNETVLYSFTGGPDGGSPSAALIMDQAGNFYGTTQNGGDTLCQPSGCGVVFELGFDSSTASWKETVLHSFIGPPDGANPLADLIRDTAGNLYGTTVGGGAGLGTVFKLEPSGVEIARYTFPDVISPYAGLIMDAAGNLYGTTAGGGSYTSGDILKLDTLLNDTVLYNFIGGAVTADGFSPRGGLIMDRAGNLYGTNYYGGAFDYGTVFKLDTQGKLTALHSFTFSDGAHPAAGLIMDNAGNLYGTTFYGVAVGTVFKVDTSGNYTVLHSFGGPDGAFPSSALISDKAGNLYGTTSAAGSGNCTDGCGTVFKLTVETPPTITSISPMIVIAGGAAFALTVNGTNFVSGATVNFNGNARATTFVSATQLTAAILASDIAAAGSVNVTVTNPGDGTSNAVSFTVVTPQQATQTIIGSVNTLLSQGVINGGQESSLLGQLQHAITMMNSGKNNGAIGNLDSFITEVNDLLASGVLSPSQAASLTSVAQSVIAAL